MLAELEVVDEVVALSLFLSLGGWPRGCGAGGGGASAFAFFMIEEIAPHDIFLTFDAAGLVGAGAGAGPGAGAGASAIESDYTSLKKDLNFKKTIT